MFGKQSSLSSSRITFLAKVNPFWQNQRFLDHVPSLLYINMDADVCPALCAQVWVQSAALAIATVSYIEK